jgi:hypothetical protein
MCKLDRIFCSTSFDSGFPLASARVLSRSGSDHTPLVWDSGESRIPKKGSFKLEKWWLAIPEFACLVNRAWSLEVNSENVIDI